MYIDIETEQLSKYSINRNNKIKCVTICVRKVPIYTMYTL